MSESSNGFYQSLPESSARLKEWLERLLESALQIDKEKEREYVERLRVSYPCESPRQLAERIIQRAKWWGAGWGGVTGLPSNPLAMIPASAADLGLTLKKEVIMAAQIALLYDPTFLDDDEPPYELLIPVMGADLVSQFLRIVAVRGGMGVTRVAIRKYLSKEVLVLFKHVALKYFLTKVTQRAVLTKSLPVVGGAIGGAWNYTEIRLVGARTVKWFEGGGLSERDDSSSSGGSGPDAPTSDDPGPANA